LQTKRFRHDAKQGVSTGIFGHSFLGFLSLWAPPALVVIFGGLSLHPKKFRSRWPSLDAESDRARSRNFPFAPR
jgi:hypothetical protein